tara:strand:+ start:983 stop:1246 length:264 start_codon:yes stop_codon:yes gene_type:complete
VLLVPGEAVGAIGVPVKTGLIFGAKTLSIFKLDDDGVIKTVVELEGLSVKLIELPEVDFSSKLFWEVESTVTVLTVCVTVAVSLAIR